MYMHERKGKCKKTKNTLAGLKSGQLLTYSLTLNFWLDASLPYVEANQEGAGSTAEAPAFWSLLSGKLSPVRLSRISWVLPYDELSTSYGDLKLSKDEKKIPGQGNALLALKPQFSLLD